MYNHVLTMYNQVLYILDEMTTQGDNTLNRAHLPFIYSYF